jgi:small-conductance mechanosensitive channel
MTSEELAPADDFYSHALGRIQRIMIVLGVAGLVTAWPYFGWRIALGFALGGAIAYLNFRWLEKVVAALAERVVQSGAPQPTGGVVARFFLRYFLMTMVAFVILTVSRQSLYGLFAGLFLAAAAILCEAAYEAYSALVRGV